jgi:transcriptional/translational regulatory protein YebC/TACO1
MRVAGCAPENAEVTMRAESFVTLHGEDAEKMMRLLDALEVQDDVQNVYTNIDFLDEVLEHSG